MSGLAPTPYFTARVSSTSTTAANTRTHRNLFMPGPMSARSPCNTPIFRSEAFVLLCTILGPLSFWQAGQLGNL
eukprot:1912020-Amphidinium_carterae.1